MGITYLVIALNLKIFRSTGDLGADSIEDDLVCNGGHEEDRDSGTESANLDYDSQRPLLVERRLFCGRRTGGFDRKTEACWTFRTWPSAQWSSPLFVNRQLCVRRPAWAKTLIDDFCCTLTHNDTDVHDKKAFSAKECKSIKKICKVVILCSCCCCCCCYCCYCCHDQYSKQLSSKSIKSTGFFWSRTQASLGEPTCRQTLLIHRSEISSMKGIRKLP